MMTVAGPARNPHPVVQLQHPHNKKGGQNDEHRAEVGAERQGSEQVFHGGILAGSHGKDAEDGEQNAHGGDEHRRDDGLVLHQRVPAVYKGCGTQGGCSEDGAAVAFVQVGTHSGHVTHVVAHIVGDSGGVTRVVFGDARLDFAHKVGAHVGRLRIDAAAHTGEKRLRTSTHAERKHGGCDDAELVSGCQSIGGNHRIEQQIPERDVEQAQPHYDQSHHRPAAEGDAQASVQRLPCGIGRTRRGISGGFHAEKARKAGEETARKEGYRHPRILHAEAVGHDGEEDDQPEEDPTHDLVLLPQVGHGAPAHGRGYLLHLRSALTLTHHLPVKVPGKGQCQHGRGRNKPEKQCIHNRVF